MKKTTTIVKRIAPMGLIGPMRPIGPMRLIRPMRPIGPMSLIGLIGLIALIALTGCSKDSAEVDVPQTQERAITFSGALQDDEEVTRAATPLSDLTHTFSVWGYKNDGYDSSTDTYTSYQTVMPGYVVNWAANSANTTTSNTNNWEYVGLTNYPQQTIKYWDFDANAYRFFAVAPGTGTNATTAYTTVLGTGAYEPNEANEANGAYTFSATVDASTQAGVDAAPYFSQLWFSTGNPTTYADKQFGRPVQLTFLKPLARVRFLFTFMEGLTFGRESVSNISFRPLDNTQTIATAGTVTVYYPLKGTDITESWSATASSGSTAFTLDNTWYAVIPSITQGAYKMSITVFGEDKTATVPAEYMQWKPGNEYTYSFKITDGGSLILDVIQVGINQWVQKGSTDRYVYNW